MRNWNGLMAGWSFLVIVLIIALLGGSTAWYVTGVVLTAGAANPEALKHERAKDHVPCPDCEDDRDLSLQEPLMYGDDVRDLQTQLRLLGFFRGEIDGFFDTETCDALKAFQKSKGKMATGIMTSDLWYALCPENNQMAEVNPAPQQPKKPAGLVSIVIDTRKLTLTVMDDGKPFRTFPCAIGKPSTPTPVGEFMVRNKWAEPGGPFGSRWMGLNIPWGTYGIHGTNRPYSIGTMASHGCIRMFNHHVAELFPWIPIGTHVTISGQEPYASVTRAIKAGDTGTDVQYVQYRIRQAGWNAGMVDGRFGTELRDALMQIQRFYGLPATGTAGPNEYHLLGIR